MVRQLQIVPIVLIKIRFKLQIDLVFLEISHFELP